ncbi:MAG: AraC family transcriptional regulator [Pseudomonadota bacterium]
MSKLDAQYGFSRFVISRQFRRCYGVSPLRYVLLRRLDRAKRCIVSGQSMADAALEAGFSDQSHMTRQFLLAFGVTPGHWKALHRVGERWVTADEFALPDCDVSAREVRVADNREANEEASFLIGCLCARLGRCIKRSHHTYQRALVSRCSRGHCRGVPRLVTSLHAGR